jgi:glycosyltransferase involved in cell wall biosynthesis
MNRAVPHVKMPVALRKFLKKIKLSAPFGVNVAGHLSSEKGVGEAVRSAVRILEAEHIPFALNDFRDPGALNSDLTCTNFCGHNPYPINLIVLGADAMSHFVREKGKRYFANRYNIAHLAWELNDFPQELLTNLKYLDELWVASTFIQSALSPLVRIPVVTMPYSLSGGLPTDRTQRLYFGLPKDRFIFLFMFDFHSFMERKNPLGLVRAFKRAFSRQDNVLLILKCSHSDLCPADLHALQAESRDANIRITDCNLNREQVRRLLHSCDCYVSLHRAEGFGLTMAEAMTMAKPVIATGYSGNMDFMTAENSFLVRHRLIPIEKVHGPYKRGFLWADPDLDHAAALMRQVYENYDSVRGVGIRAQQEILATLRPEVVGRQFAARLDRLSEL